MKKLLPLLILLMLLLCVPALGEEAHDITDRCTYALSNNKKQLSAMFDNDYATHWSSNHRGYVEITSPSETPICGLYVSWGKFITKWCIQAQNEGGAWKTVYETEDEYYNQYIPLSQGYNAVRLTCQSPDYEHVVNISELRVFSEGELPSSVQQWKTLDGKADLVLLVTDPGDEFLFFGGLIPKYIAQGREVMLCVVVNTDAPYKCEMLDGLWQCGLTNYPYIAYFKPNMQATAKQQYAVWSEVQFVRHVSRIVRIYKPDVLVTHAIDGEGVDGGHKVCADAAIKSITTAMDNKYDVGYGVKLFGNWQLKKLYLHLYGSNRTVLDYDQPLDLFNGKTAEQMAEAAYGLQTYQNKKHASAQLGEGIYDGSSFGLYFSTVGEDVTMNDLFEHLD